MLNFIGPGNSLDTDLPSAYSDAVFQGDILETGADGPIGVFFVDESVLSLGEEGRMTNED